MLFRTLALLVLTLVLTGCGAAAAPDSMTAEAVHQQFIDALLANDRQTALDLTGTITFKEGMVDKWLGEGAALQRESQFTGKFVRVETRPPVDEGQGKTATSVWYHEREQICYETDLAQTDAGWKVIEWSWMGQGGCPTS